MVKSHKWCLNRINYDGGEERVFRLNEGDTTCGRNKAADITSTSKICSRDHCVISLISDKVTLSNKSSNGTYLNYEKIGEAPYELKHNDIIGLGCNQTIFNLTNKDTWDTYSVYQLVDKTKHDVKNSTVMVNHGDVIDLVSDNEENSKSIIVNEKEKNDDKAATSKEVHRKAANGSNKITKSSIIESAAKTEIATISPQSDLDQDNDDNEIFYSQQVLMEIKQEVNCPEDNFAHADDFSIIIESDESDDESPRDWTHKLSQDQDFVVQKVTESAQNNKRKITKQIEAIPLIPAKRQRKNSTIAQRKHSGKLDNKKPRTGDNSNVNLNAPNTSKPRRENKNDETRSIDLLDPCVTQKKKIEKQSTFEDALKRIDIMPKKKRTAHLPKSHRHTNTPTDLIPILRHKNGCWPSDGNEKKIKGRKVRFSSEPPQVREFTPDDEDRQQIIIPSPVKSRPTDLALMESFENDPLHAIISDITEWKTEWIPYKNITPPINGVNFVISPMTDKYTSFNVYKENVIPLLKHELWSSIQAENRKRNRFEVKILSMNLVKRADRKRYVFHLQVTIEGANARANVGDFVMVEADASPHFFAYVTEQKFTRSGYSRTTYLTMESSEAVVKLKNGELSTLFITPIANIRTELKLFNAVFYLDRTTFKDLILNPDTYKKPNIPNRISKFRYSGYDKLNDEQLSILKSIYNKCLSGDTNVSLIEGPPGTGKTRLIVSTILQLLFGQEMKRKLKILVLTPSNAAVDIIAKKLIHIREKLNKNEKQKILNVVRFGVLGSMHPEVRKIAVDNLKNVQALSPSAQSGKVRNLLENKKTHEDWIEKLKNEPNVSTTVIQDKIKDRQQCIATINETIRKITNTSSHSEYDAIAEVLASARVVCSTLSSSINLKQFVKKFDVCFIDEASQCTEPWSLVPLQYNISSLILVGDSNQLSPVILSTVCREYRMGVSLFTRLYDKTSRSCSLAQSTYSMTTQYRMHPDICSFSNEYFYKNRLTSAPETREHFILHPYIVFSLPCLQSNHDMINFYNADEAKFIVSMLKVMIKHASPKDFSYGIITPYVKQKMEIQKLLSTSQTLVHFDIPVNTIDSYQGQEKDIIILCTTRTTGIGFLANPQRLNVALTRAKRTLIVCGNFTSISNSSVWKHLLNDAERRKKIHNISSDYTFHTIANLLVSKKSKQHPKE